MDLLSSPPLFLVSDFSRSLNCCLTYYFTKDAFSLMSLAMPPFPANPLEIMLDQSDSFLRWHDWMVDEGRVVDVVYLDFSKAFNTVSRNILLRYLRKCGLDEWLVRWTENWLNGRAQRIVISDAESSWRPVTSGAPGVSARPSLAQLLHP